MKKLHVTIGANVLVFADPAHFGALISSLAEVQTAEKDWNNTITFKPTPITFEFVDPINTDENPAVAAIRKEMEQYRDWWSKGNEKERKLNAEISDLKKRMDDMVSVAPADGKVTLDLRDAHRYF